MKSLPLFVFSRGVLSCFGLLILSLIIVRDVWAQYETDLQVTVESQPKTVRGGEHIRYTYLVRNNGPSKSEAYLLGGNEQLVQYDSAKTSKGACSVNHQDPWVLRCIFGDLLPNESATVEVFATVNNIDNLNSACGSKEESLRAFLLRKSGGANSEFAPLNEVTCGLAWVRVDASIKDTNDENDRVGLTVKLRSSANKPPLVKILSPKEDEVFVKPAGEKMSRTVLIEASDPDGSVVAVKVGEPLDLKPVGMDEKGNMSFEYQGARYSAAELQAYLIEHPPPEKLATPTGNNIFAYTMKSMPYGRNRLSVVGIDDGGRETYAAISFEVKSDSTIEIISPTKNQVIEPGSTMTVETISRLKEGRLQDVTIAGDGVAQNGEPAKMKLVSKQGNVYRHRFQIDQVPPNSVWSNLHVQLNEAEGGYADAYVGFLVRDLPRMEFTSLHDGETVQPEMRDGARTVEIRVEIEKRSRNDNYELFIDGKYHNSFTSNDLYWISPASGKHTLQIVATFGSVRNRIEIARSPLITVTVK